MLKKYVLIGMMGLIVLLSVSAFLPASYKPVLSNLFSPAETGFRTAHMWNGFYIPSMDVTGFLADPVKLSVAGPSGDNFRLAHMWNGKIIPSMDVTGFLADPVKLSIAGSSGDNFRLAHMWNGNTIPSMDVTGFLANPVKTYVPPMNSIPILPKLYSGH